MRRRGRASLRWLPRVIPTLIYLSVLILSTWLLYYSLTSPYFTVWEIAISGNRLVATQEAREAAGSLGRNLLLVRSEDVERSVRRISAVKDARVSPSFPARVAVEVRERTPLLRWQAREGSFLVDREGVAFSRENPPAPVLVVRDLDGPAMDVGSRVDLGVLASIEVLDAALPSVAGLRTPSFDYSKASGIAVPVDDGPRIIFGDAAGLEMKLATLAAIREHLEATKARAEVIDLRYMGRPVYVLAPAPPAKPPQPSRP